jgi:3-oxoadipate enol-lactonase
MTLVGSVSTPRGRFGLRRTGSGGTPVLLLHPLALAGAVWDPMAAHLGRTRAVLAADARGHGDSDWDGADFTIADLAADAAAIIEAESDGAPVDVIGLSMGGSTAVALAADRPDLVRRLVLADATACYGPDRVGTWAQRAEQAENTPRDEQLAYQQDRWFTDAFRVADPAEVARVSDIFVRTNGKAHAAACRAFGAMDNLDRLPEITAPTLVVVGEQDYATPPVLAEQLANGILGATLWVLPATRHLSLIHRRDLWPSIAEFLTA